MSVAKDFNPIHVQHVRFSGTNKLGAFRKSYTLPGGLTVHSGISHATLHNCVIGNDVHIYNIKNYIANYVIDDGSYIENVHLLLVDRQRRQCALPDALGM